MPLTILLILILLFAIAWMVLAILRDKAIHRHAEILQALSSHSFQQTIQRREASHQETLQHITGRDDILTSESEPVELPDWVRSYVEVKEDKGLSYSLYNLGFGGSLSSVPSVWFHGAFGVMIILLTLLGLAQASGLWDGV